MFTDYSTLEEKIFNGVKSYFEKIEPLGSDDYKNAFYALVAQYGAGGQDDIMMESTYEELMESIIIEEFNKLSNADQKELKEFYEINFPKNYYYEDEVENKDGNKDDEKYSYSTENLTSELNGRFQMWIDGNFSLDALLEADKEEENEEDKDQNDQDEESETISKTQTENKIAKILHFRGPFKFTKDENYLFKSDFVKSEGIYIWTIKSGINSINYVHYIGETTCFGERQKEHLLQITGLNYRIPDPYLAQRGIVKILWDGMWRDKTLNAVENLLENYLELCKSIVEYIGLINVYFAPTKFERHLRKHIKDCIAWDFRNNDPDLQTFYPADNHVEAKAERLGQALIMDLPDDIAGIKRKLII